MVYVWLAALIAFAILEAATVQLVTIWFAGGALAGLIAALCKAPVWLQIALFAVVSVLALILTRPLVKKITAAKFSPTNADRFIGQTGVVTKRIDNLQASGEVRVKGAVWTARSEDEAVAIEENETVTVKRIDGAKLIVAKQEQEAE